MGQHDYIISNDTGQNVRNDINSALAAIVSQNSGATAPSTTYAFQFWADTTTGLLKIRDAANASWIVIGTMGAANLALLPLSGGVLTGVLQAIAGAVGAPGIAISGDTDTGIFSPGANELSITVGGTELLRADLATYLQFLGTAGILLPIGTTVQRPTGVNGIMRYNSDLNQFEGYKNGNWGSIGGGGGGAGFSWRKLAGTAPTETEENGEIVNLFGAGLAQELYTSIKVPASYSAGTQVLVYVSGYSPSTSNTILFKAQSTLIKKATDAFSSTTNQRTTTNSALTNTVASQLREFALDVTDSTGKINGVAVSAGDVIKVRMYRDATDTDTADLRMIADATDAKFS